MPLLKLWNALLGRAASGTSVRCDLNESTSVDSKTSPAPSAAAPSAVAGNANESKSASRKPKQPKKSKESSAPAIRLASLETPVAPVAAPRQFKVVNRGEHAEVCRLVVAAQSSQPTLSILEIGVGDGSRAEAVMQSLLAVGPQLNYRYMVIDQFEMTGGPISLRDFHQRMRGLGVRPQVFPEPLVAGLSRFARTVGSADLILTTSEDSVWQSPEIQAILPRIVRPATAVLRATANGWSRDTNRSLSSNPKNIRKVG